MHHHVESANVRLQLKEWRSDAVRTCEHERSRFMTMRYKFINTFCLYIICRDGVLLLEEGSRTFSIMPSLLDEEEDTLVKSLGRDL